MVAATPGIWLVTLRYARAYIADPMLERLADATTLEGFVRAVHREDRALRDWHWKQPGEPAPDGDDPMAWIEANTDASVSFVRESHLVQYVHEAAHGEIVARYLFDRVYARAHPEAIDREHLAILHGTIAAKILDEGVVILERDGLAASLRWLPTTARGVRFTRAGGRIRG